MPNLFDSPLEDHIHRAKSAATVLRLALESLGDAPTRDEIDALLAHAYAFEDAANAAREAFQSLVETGRKKEPDDTVKTQEIL